MCHLCTSRTPDIETVILYRLLVRIRDWNQYYRTYALAQPYTRSQEKVCNYKQLHTCATALSPATPMINLLTSSVLIGIMAQACPKLSVPRHVDPRTRRVGIDVLGGEIEGGQG